MKIVIVFILKMLRNLQGIIKISRECQKILNRDTLSLFLQEERKYIPIFEYPCISNSLQKLFLPLPCEVTARDGGLKYFSFSDLRKEGKITPHFYFKITIPLKEEDGLFHSINVETSTFPKFTLIVSNKNRETVFERDIFLENGKIRELVKIDKFSA